MDRGEQNMVMTEAEIRELLEYWEEHNLLPGCDIVIYTIKEILEIK